VTVTEQCLVLEWI